MNKWFRTLGVPLLYNYMDCTQENAIVNFERIIYTCDECV
jgi:hypothetical protein